MLTRERHRVPIPVSGRGQRPHRLAAKTAGHGRAWGLAAGGPSAAGSSADARSQRAVEPCDVQRPWFRAAPGCHSPQAYPPCSIDGHFLLGTNFTLSAVRFQLLLAEREIPSRTLPQRSIGVQGSPRDLISFPGQQICPDIIILGLMGCEKK